MLEGNSTKRTKRNTNYEQELVELYKSKTSERLVLGSSLVPIPIVFSDNSHSIVNEFNSPDRSLNITENHRKARVVGGEDGENGEWCWQVALINSLNQYLCGGALIGRF